MNYFSPDSIGSAADALKSSGGMLIAGGTDLCVQMAERVYSPEALIDISRIESLRGIRLTGDSITIGACVTVAEIAASDILPGSLRQGAKSIGSPQIRNLGTIGGNICNASPCGDTLAPLLSLDARFVLYSAGGTRGIESKHFFTGPKQTVRGPTEILASIEIPVTSGKKLSAFRMIGKRNGQVISQVNAAVSVTVDDGRISDVRAAVGSVAPVPLRLGKLEEYLSGKDIRSLNMDEIIIPVQEDISPINDVRSTESYRRKVTVSLVFDALADCAGQYSGKPEGVVP